MYSTGTLCHEMSDFAIDGLIPCVFNRVYRSSSLSNGPLGFGWHWPWDVKLTLRKREFVQTVAGGLIKERFHLDDAVNGLVRSKSGATLFLGKAHVLVSLRNNWIYRFQVPGGSDSTVPLESIQDLYGNVCHFLNRNGNLQELIDADGRRYAILRDREQHVIGLEIVEGGVPGLPRRLVTYVYDFQGDLVRVIDRCGVETEYQYQSHLMVAYRNRVGGWYYADYDESSRCVRIDRSD